MSKKGLGYLTAIVTAIILVVTAVIVVQKMEVNNG